MNMDTSLPPEMQEAAQRLISDVFFEDCLKEVAEIHMPKIGDEGVSPLMVLYEPPKKDGEKYALTLIAFAGDMMPMWNDTKQRFQFIEGMGMKCAKEGMQPIATFI